MKSLKVVKFEGISKWLEVSYLKTLTSLILKWLVDKKCLVTTNQKLWSYKIHNKFSTLSDHFRVTLICSSLFGFQSFKKAFLEESTKYFKCISRVIQTCSDKVMHRVLKFIPQVSIRGNFSFQLKKLNNYGKGQTFRAMESFLYGFA